MRFLYSCAINSWQDSKWRRASRGPSAIAEFIVFFRLLRPLGRFETSDTDVCGPDYLSVTQPTVLKHWRKFSSHEIVAWHDNCPKWCTQLRRRLEQQRSAARWASVCWGVSADRCRLDRLRSVARRGLFNVLTTALAPRVHQFADCHRARPSPQQLQSDISYIGKLIPLLYAYIPPVRRGGRHRGLNLTA